MENLIKPEFGLSFWTILIFFLLVLILSRFVWKPILKRLDEREEKIRKDIEDAQNMRQEAEKYKIEIEKKLAQINKESEEILKKIRYEANTEKEKILEKAQAQADLILENARKEIEALKKQAEKDLESRVVDISAMISKKVLAEIVDKKIEERIVELTLKEHKNYSKN